MANEPTNQGQGGGTGGTPAGAAGSGTPGQAGTGQTGTTPAPQPQIDAAQLQQMIDSSVSKGLTNLAQQAQEAQRKTALQQAGAQQAQDPLTQMVVPIVAPAIRELGLRAEAAADAATFYARQEREPELTTLRTKYQDKIEALFKREVENGRFIDRSSVWNYLKGGELYNEVVEAEIAIRARKAREAQAAGVAGAGSPHLPEPALRTDPYAQTPEQLDKNLKEVEAKGYAW